MALERRRILVTGASGGLGVPLCEGLLAMGHEVIAVARLRTKLDELRAQVRNSDRLHVAECDVTDADGVERLMNAVDARQGFDAVVHAVGAFSFGKFADMDLTEASRLISGNLQSTVVVVHSALRRMVARRAGRIVVIAAERALSPAANMALYGATKAAVIHLVQALSDEVRGSGVQINALLPGTIDTEANRKTLSDPGSAGLVRPVDIVKVVLWLLSAEAAAVQGACIRLPSGA